MYRTSGQLSPAIHFKMVQKHTDVMTQNNLHLQKYQMLNISAAFGQCHAEFCKPLVYAGPTSVVRPQLAHLALYFLQVAVAQQIYDYVDQRIRRLDKDLRAFDAELTKDRIRQGLPVSFLLKWQAQLIQLCMSQVCTCLLRSCC